MTKAEMYKILHKEDPQYGWGAVHLLPEISLFVDFLKPKEILDYGCGKGNLVRALSQRYSNTKVYGFDPGTDEFSVLPVKNVDFVVNTDVLEHIPEDEFPTTLERIVSLSRYVFFYLNHAKSTRTLADGSNVHCTVKPREWYQNVFLHYFDTLHFFPGVQSHNSLCITFDVPEYVKNQYLDFIHMHTMVSNSGVKINQIIKLLEMDFSKFESKEDLIFYGFGNASRAVYQKIKGHHSLKCFIDQFSDVTEYDGIPVLRPTEVHWGGTIVVFPTYDFVSISAYLESILDCYDVRIVRAEDFFSAQ